MPIRRSARRRERPPADYLPASYKRKEVIGDCTLYLADCTHVLPTLSHVPALVTDPPYGRRRTSGGVGKFGSMKWGGSRDLRWDDEPPHPHLLQAAIAKADHHIIWGANFFNLGIAQCFLVWDKGACFRNRKFSEAEIAWTSLDLNVKVLTYDPLARRAYKGKVHPTQKPIAVMLWCLSLLPRGCHTVLDPFMGSGTTGIACIETGRRFVGIEREEPFFDDACERIARAFSGFSPLC